MDAKMAELESWLQWCLDHCDDSPEYNFGIEATEKMRALLRGEADPYFARHIAAEERERIRRAFMSRFKGVGEVYFDYLNGDEEAEACAAQFWNEVLDEIEE